MSKLYERVIMDPDDPGIKLSAANGWVAVELTSESRWNGYVIKSDAVVVLCRLGGGFDEESCVVQRNSLNR